MKNHLTAAAVISAFLALVFASSQVIEAARRGLELCAYLILPTLFPFFVISILLNRTGLPAAAGKLLAPLAVRLFGVSGAGSSALIIGLTGGYPLGAAYIADMQREKLITDGEAEHLLLFCNNSGPAFLIGAIGAGIFHSSAAGLILYASHILSAIIIGIVFRRGGAELNPPSASGSSCFSEAFPPAVNQAVQSALNVCGFVICFTVFAGLLESWGVFAFLSGWLSRLCGMPAQTARVLLTGFLELGTGVGAMAGLEPAPANIALAAAVVGWGGISVYFQTVCVLSDTNIKGTLHMAGRLMSAVISAGLAYLGARLFL